MTMPKTCIMCHVNIRHVASMPVRYCRACLQLIEDAHELANSIRRAGWPRYDANTNAQR